MPKTKYEPATMGQALWYRLTRWYALAVFASNALFISLDMLGSVWELIPFSLTLMVIVAAIQIGVAYRVDGPGIKQREKQALHDFYLLRARTNVFDLAECPDLRLSSPDATNQLLVVPFGLSHPPLALAFFTRNLYRNLLNVPAGKFRASFPEALVDIDGVITYFGSEAILHLPEGYFEALPVWGSQDEAGLEAEVDEVGDAELLWQVPKSMRVNRRRR